MIGAGYKNRVQVKDGRKPPQSHHSQVWHLKIFKNLTTVENSPADAKQREALLAARANT